jgi:exo-rhamnogalacturonan lyase-like protein
MKRCGLTVLAICLACTPSMALEVKLAVADTAGVGRVAEPVTTGVPFAKGEVKDVSKLSVSVGGRAIPAQFIKTVPWDDGSVRWALLDTQVDVPAGGKAGLIVSDSGRAAKPAAALKVTDTAAILKVSTGPLQFTIDEKKAKFSPFASLKVDGKELIHGGKGLAIYMPGGAVKVAGAPDSVKIEQFGPMKVVIACKGKFPGIHNDLLRYTVRITAYAGKKFVKMHVWLENQGAYGYGHGQVKQEWFGFDGMAVELGLLMGDKVSASCEGVAGPAPFQVEQLCPQGNWKSLAYTVTADGKTLKQGARTNGLVTVSGGDRKVTTAVRHFWQNYEKAIEVETSTLKLWLWPRSGEWPRSKVRRGASSRANEFKQFKKPGMYHLSGARHKGHQMILDFSGRDPKATAATLSAPLMAQATPEYYASTEAAPGWFAPASFKAGDAAYDQKVANWNRQAWNAVDPDSKNRGSLAYARNGGADGRGFWYGWMDFGDLLWRPGTSQLHYDWTWVMLLNWMRQGQPEFLEMGTQMARHRIDVDQCWSDRDESAYRAVCAYEKGYTDIHHGRGVRGRPTTTHTWVSGVVLYYMLTGEQKAYEAAMRTYQGIRERGVAGYRKGPKTGGQMRSTGWSILGLCSLYDLTADKKYLDDAMVLFKNHVVPTWKKDGPYLQKGLQYYYSTQGLCELQHRTGDKEVMKLLEEGCAGKFPEKTYSEWRIFLTNIYSYVGLKQNKPEYLVKARTLFNSYVSSSKSPPAYRIGSGAWTKETCKTIRNGHILQYVLWAQSRKKER